MSILEKAMIQLALINSPLVQESYIYIFVYMALRNANLFADGQGLCVGGDYKVCETQGACETQGVITPFGLIDKSSFLQVIKRKINNILCELQF